MTPVTIPQAIPYRVAQHWRWMKPGRRVDYVVIHSAETPERPTTAEALGTYFAAPKQLRGGKLVPVTASAHYSVDCDSIVCSVRPEHTAFHVRAPGVNDRSVGIELAGRAQQTRLEWLDAYGSRMLPLAAWLTASMCLRFDVPMVYVSPAALVLGERGICGHVDVRDAFGVDTHWDPGPSFPWPEFIDLVEQSAGALSVQADDEPTRPGTPNSKSSTSLRAVRP